MKRILFVCHGNICRSTMAQFVFSHLAQQMGRAGEFYVDSAGVSAEELGNPVHYGTRRKLAQMGIPCGEHRARVLRKREYNEYDLLIGMDEGNLRSMRRILGGDPDGKMYALLDFAGRSGESIADPYYTGNFDTTFADVMAGCQGLLNRLTEKD
ncbi:MAG: low molecular weight phosphotyrosine protein phosphatase [Ruminococcaceae bacterium]|nr:low molecular weight phosphotyrosine protein phosphatase [Oscillospiraceae bacterium]